MLVVEAIVFIAIPAIVGIAMTVLTFRRMTPLAFQCQRCGTEFRQPPHRDFPAACPHCGARDWNA